MEPVGSVLTQTSFKPFSTIRPVDAREYDNPENPDRRWEVVYGWGKGVRKYLTDEERKYFLGEISRGKSMIQVGSLTLTDRFLYIAPIRDGAKKTEYELVEIDGKQVYKEV